MTASIRLRVELFGTLIANCKAGSNFTAHKVREKCRKCEENEGKTRFRETPRDETEMISSQPRYDHFDTSPKTAVPLFLKTAVFPRLRLDNGIIISQNSGICKSKIKKIFIQGKKCCGGYIRGGEGAAERKHLTKAALCDIIMS